MTYYDDREKAFADLKSRIMVWINDKESEELNLEHTLMEVSLTNKVGVLTLNKLLKFYLDKLKLAGLSFEHNEQQKKLNKTK